MKAVRQGAVSGVVLALAFLVLSAAAHAATPPPGFTETVSGSGLTQPTAVAFLPDGRLLVTEKTGGLRLLEGGRSELLTTLSVCTASEMGLLGIAVDPAFSTNGFVYLYRTKPGPDGCATADGRHNQVVRLKLVNGAVEAGSLTEPLSGIRTDNGNHNGGGLRIGPDGKLWVSVGDTGRGDGGAPGQSTNPYAQDLGALEGKILRLELDGSPAAGNPFIGQAGARPEIFAYGFRNPWRFGFDPVTGRGWVGDVGQSTLEELDIVVAGGNYAWPRCEGTLPTGCQEPGDIDPVFTYSHTGSDSLGRTIIGGAFAGRPFGSYDGYYFFADFIASKIYWAPPMAAHDGLAGTPREFLNNAGGPVDIVFGPDGALYYVAFSAGQVRRIAYTAYPHPFDGRRVRVALVPAFTRCTAPNTRHGGPLDLESCRPPVQRSPYVTLPAAGATEATASAVVRAICYPDPPGTYDGCAQAGDQRDVSLSVNISDARAKPSLVDYTGELDARLKLRITDRENGTSASEAATVSDIELSFPFRCVATDGPEGATCTMGTTVEAITPGAVKEGNLAVWELDDVRVRDGGADGLVATDDNRVFLTQGVFVP
jgi:glucose/arabinose dehydrogenase